MIFQDVKPGDTFEVESSWRDEWSFRGKWMRTTDGRLCVCLTQGVSNQGSTMRWKDGIPVRIIEKNHISKCRSGKRGSHAN